VAPDSNNPSAALTLGCGNESDLAMVCARILMNSLRCKRRESFH